LAAVGIQTLQQRDPVVREGYLGQRERILGDGAIPAKYKILMTMIVDALLSHPDGVTTIANRARAAGASSGDPGGSGSRLPVRRDAGAGDGGECVQDVVGPRRRAVPDRGNEPGWTGSTRARIPRA
jgi:hypothetical protein